MAEEAVADSGALGRALDQAGNVGEHEIDLLVADDPQFGMKGGEGIVADLGLGVGDGVQEGRLAGIGQADQADVGDQLQAKPHPQLRARPAGPAPGQPVPCGRGARLVELLKLALPRPPSPPSSRTIRWPIRVRSASTCSLSSLRIWVPTGTLTTRSLPPAPVWLRPAPPLPRGALKCWV